MDLRITGVEGIDQRWRLTKRGRDAGSPDIGLLEVPRDGTLTAEGPASVASVGVLREEDDGRGLSYRGCYGAHDGRRRGWVTRCVEWCSSGGDGRHNGCPGSSGWLEA